MQFHRSLCEPPIKRLVPSNGKQRNRRISQPVATANETYTTERDQKSLLDPSNEQRSEYPWSGRSTNQAQALAG